MSTWDYTTRMALMSDSRQGNGNVRDTSNPDGARHAADTTVQPNLDAVRALRGGTDGYTGRHRAS